MHEHDLHVARLTTPCTMTQHTPDPPIGESEGGGRGGRKVKMVFKIPPGAQAGDSYGEYICRFSDTVSGERYFSN